MTEERWRELLRRHPGRIIYPQFDPDRKREPWVRIASNANWQRVTGRDARRSSTRVVRAGWDDPQPEAGRPSS